MHTKDVLGHANGDVAFLSFLHSQEAVNQASRGLLQVPQVNSSNINPLLHTAEIIIEFLSYKYIHNTLTVFPASTLMQKIIMQFSESLELLSLSLITLHGKISKGDQISMMINKDRSLKSY